MRLSTKQVSAQQASPLSTTTFKTIITPCATLPTISIPNALQIAMLYPSSALKTSIATSQNTFTKTKTTKKTSFERKAFFCCDNIFRLNFKSILFAQIGQISVILVLRDFHFRLFAIVDYTHDNSVHDYVEHPAYRPAQI